MVTDDRARLMLTFFLRSPKAEYILQAARPDMVGMFAGTVSSFRGRRQLVHPEYEMLPGAPPNADLTPELAGEFATELIPVYPASAKFSSWAIAKAIRTVLDTLDVGGGPAAGRSCGSGTGWSGGPRRSGPCTGRWTRRTGTGPGTG